MNSLIIKINNYSLIISFTILLLSLSVALSDEQTEFIIRIKAKGTLCEGSYNADLLPEGKRIRQEGLLTENSCGKTVKVISVIPVCDENEILKDLKCIKQSELDKSRTKKQNHTKNKKHIKEKKDLYGKGKK